jgi:hypothetical protein
MLESMEEKWVGETFKEERTVVREKHVGEMKRAAFGLGRIGLPTKAAVLPLGRFW